MADNIGDTRDFTLNVLHKRLTNSGLIISLAALRYRVNQCVARGAITQRRVGRGSVFRSNTIQRHSMQTMDDEIRTEKITNLKSKVGDNRRCDGVTSCKNPNRQNWKGSRMIGKPGEVLLMIGGI